MSFDSGVKGYIVGRAVVEQAFPIDFHGVIHAKCRLCRFLYYYKDIAICRITDERLLFPELKIGEKCPLDFDEVNKEEE